MKRKTAHERFPRKSIERDVFGKRIKELRRKDYRDEYRTNEGIGAANRILNADLGKEVRGIIESRGKARVLEVGCGTGQALADLKEEFGGKVEVSGIGLSNLKSRSDAGKLVDSYYVGAFETYPFPRRPTYDLIFSRYGSTAFPTNLQRNIAKAAVLLREGGKAFLHVRIDLEDARGNQVNKTISGEMERLKGFEETIKRYGAAEYEVKLANVRHYEGRNPEAHFVVTMKK